MTTRLFGLTGNIASGKSTVARRFAARGVPVLDADRFARDVVAPGTEGLREVVAAFGPTVLDPAGALDRRALGALVFADPARRARLNAITHPRIAAATQAAL
ncbi:MAG TPA: dephospho-CoA kinase, partial [Polyangiaceae bacterium]|nr:dephospho-CoA kinase [Polyangiaceae bacterium]